MSTRVLIADDSACIRAILGTTLKEAGYEVLEAIDGSDALTKANDFQPRIVITDLNMPRMDGIELIRCLRADPGFQHTPIILVTTESQQARKLEGKSAGATGWIVKPFKPEQLLSVIRRVIG